MKALFWFVVVVLALMALAGFVFDWRDPGQGILRNDAVLAAETTVARAANEAAVQAVQADTTAPTLTPTPVPPTDTPPAPVVAVPAAVPTAAPTPIAVLFPTATPIPAAATENPLNAETAYSDAVVPLTTAYASALERLGGRFIAAGSDSTLLQNAEWRTAVEFDLTAMQTTSGRVRGLTAPTLFSSAHAKMLQAADELDSMIGNVRQFFATNNADYLILGTQDMNEASALYQKASAEIEFINGTGAP